MQMRCVMSASLVLVLTWPVLQAQELDRTILSVGEVQGVKSVPVTLLENLCPGIQLVEAVRSRSEVFPSTTPLPDSLNELPDVVSALVGFWDSDIPVLCARGHIEPVDSIFEELGLQPRAVLPPAIYDALSWNGKIWAIPYRVETFVLGYREDVLKRIGVKPSFDNWQEMFVLAERLSFDADPARQISGFSPVKMPDEHWGSFLISIALDVPNDSSTTFCALLGRVQEHKVIRPENFDWQDPQHDSGIRYELSRGLSLSPQKRIVQVPMALTPGMEATIRAPGFIEAFAIRKNTKEKMSGARAFLKSLLTKDTQLALVDATRIDRPKTELTIRYIPVCKHVLDSVEFAQVMSLIPAYGVLAEACRTAHYTPADTDLFQAKRQAVLGRAKEARDLIGRTQDRMAGALKLAEPLNVNPSDRATLAPDISKY